VHDLLKQGARGSRAKGVLRDGLVVLEVALTVVLVSGAALFGKSLDRLLSVHLGFRPDHVAMAGILFSPALAPATQIARFDRLASIIAAQPGVEQVGMITRLPLEPGEGREFEIAGHPAAEPGHLPSANYRAVHGDYFGALGISLERGRVFQRSDDAGAPRVVVINHTLAQRYFSGADPIGAMLVRGRETARIVGVVGDVVISNVDAPVPPTFYAPFAQDPGPFLRVVVRTTRDNAATVGELRAAMGSIDPGAALVDPATMDEVLARSQSVFLRRFPLLLAGAFAATTLALAVIGIYGVVSYSVGQRRRELGIRMALGAESRRVMALVMRHAAWMAGTGTMLGIIAALFAARLLGGLLYGVRPTDPTTYASVALLLALVAVGAALLPARRATRVDPAITLRAE
jgi:predicted permease